MKILIGTIAQGGVTWFLRGIGHAFSASGNQVREFIHGKESPLDLFAEWIPDLVLCYGYNSCLDRPLKKAIQRYKPRIGLYVPAHPLSEVGKIAPTRPDLTYDVASQADLEGIEEISELIDFVFIHHYKDCAQGYLEGWQNHVKKYIGIGMACDTVLYKEGKPREEFLCDGSIISGYWEYKARKLKPYLFPICEPSKGYNIKIFGASPFPLIQSLGQIREDWVSDLWASSKVNFQIHEPQAELGYEASERTFKVLGAGGFVLSDHVDVLDKHYFPNGELPMAKTPSEYHEMFDHFVKKPEERLLYTKKGQQTVLNNHTYLDRAEQIFNELNLVNEANQCRAVKQQWLTSSSAI